MARLWSSGFELQSVTAGVEWLTISGSLTIDATTKRSGSASLRVNLSSTDNYYVASQLGSATQYYVRAYVKIATKPSAQAFLLGSFFITYPTYVTGGVVVNTDGTLALVGYNNGGSAWE